MSDSTKPSDADNADNLSKHLSTPSSGTKTKQTIPTINPDIEFVNRTLP